MKQFTGDAENTPLSEILKALGYSYKDDRHYNPRVGRKEIYKDNGTGLVPEDEILFAGTAHETNEWLKNTGQIKVEEQPDE